MTPLLLLRPQAGRLALWRNLSSTWNLAPQSLPLSTVAPKTTKQTRLPDSWITSPKRQRTEPGTAGAQSTRRWVSAEMPVDSSTPPSRTRTPATDKSPKRKSPAAKKKSVAPFMPEEPSPINHNKRITDILAAVGESEKNLGNDWKAQAYARAIMSIAAFPKPLESGKEAKELPGVGDGIARKIDEIIATGKLERLEADAHNERLQAIKLLTKVRGIGPAFAAELYDDHGVRTLEDLTTKAQLTKHQRTGLQYFDEFQQRIPRAEMDQWSSIIKDVILDVNPRYLITTVGSYRRGKELSRDIDILLAHKGFTSENAQNADVKGKNKKFLGLVVKRLHERGYITDDISRVDVKYMGVCKLPDADTVDGSSLHRRIDIRLAPFDAYWPAVCHSTGSDQFNQWLRVVANEKGFILSEYGLRTKDDSAEIIPVSSEQELFEKLGVTWREPSQRNW